MNTRQLFFLVSLLPLVAGLACAGNGVKTGPSEEDIAQARQEVRRAQTQVEQQVKTRMSPEKAKQLAARHLALQQTSWGKPVEVTEDENRFYVAYETPEPERRLIGQRVLIVDKESGLVTAQKRR